MSDIDIDLYDYLRILYESFPGNNSRSIMKDALLSGKCADRLKFLFWRFNRQQISQERLINELEKMFKRELKFICDDLFKNTSFQVGKELSNIERKKKELTTDKSLNYGEIDYYAFYDSIAILKQFGIKKTNDMIFYDLGSGTGKALVAARLIHDFSKIHGIEIMESLYNEGNKCIEEFNNKILTALNLNTSSNLITSELGSLLDIDWSDGDIVYCNSTAFDQNLMELFSQKASCMKSNSILITYTKPINNNEFDIVGKIRTVSINCALYNT